MDIIFTLMVVLIWVIFALYWLFSWIYEKATRKEKPVEKSTSHFSFWVIRIIFSVIVVFLVSRGELGLLTNTIVPYYLAVSIAGTVLLACGIGFAIWARINLSTNWSNVIVLKKGQTLTKTGPYSIVRHPIYTGLLFGAMGTFLAVGSLLTIILAVGIILFVLNRIRIEEKLMLEKFGKQYIQYQKETKKIIPFVY